MIYFTSDHHFGHRNIINLCNRPFKSLDEMHDEMVRRWNETVTKIDTVYHLGDFSLNKKYVKEFLPKLNGLMHILVCGNHDACHRVHHKNEASLLKMEMYYRQAGFFRVFDELTLPPDILLNHLPYEDRTDDRYSEYRPKDKNQWLIHGHVHNKWRVNNRMINVGVDVWDFYPVGLDRILKIIIGENR